MKSVSVGCAYGLRILAIVLLCLGCGQLWAAQPYGITADIMQAVPSQYATYWLEQEAAAPADIMASDPAQWTPVTQHSISAGPQSSPVWYRLGLINAAPEAVQRLLEVRWINIRALDVYVRRDSGSEHRFFGIDEQGTLTPAGDSSFVTTLNLDAGEQAELFIRVDTPYFPFVPLFIWQQDAYQQHRESVHQWYFLGFGALLALLLYNLSLTVFLRDRTYLFYCSYVVSILVYELAFSGLGVCYLWGENAWLYEHGLALGIYASFIAGTLFLRGFLNVPAYSRRLTWLVDVSLVYWLVALLLLLISGIFFMSSVYMSMLCCVFAVGIAVELWRRGNPAAPYYLSAWVALLTFTLLTLLMVVGLIPYHPVSEHGQMIGFVLEMLLLSFALAARISLERNQRELAQQQALQLQVQINQERDNTIRAQDQVLALEKQTKQVLEQRVEERTEALQQALGKLEQANNQLTRLTVTDALTGVANRRHFDEALEREIRRAERGGQPLSLILIDIDRFKLLNDIHGHLAGDECLRQFAAMLQEAVPRSTDLVARFGGEEFAVILPGTDQAAACVVAEKIRAATQDLQFQYKQQAIPITVSLGVVGRCPEAGCSAADLLDAADSALYEAKNGGRNRSVAASYSM